MGEQLLYGKINGGAGNDFSSLSLKNTFPKENFYFLEKHDSILG
jgi:hypothetical protein